MTGYEFLKFLHVCGAIAWVGGGLGLLILSRRLVAAGDHATLLKAGEHSQALGTRLFMPASLVTIGAGVAMVATTPQIGFTDLWILMGFGGVVLSGVAQMTLSSKAEARFVAAATDHGVDSPEVARAARGLTLGSVADITVLVLVVWAMVVKPTL